MRSPVRFLACLILVLTACSPSPQSRNSENETRTAQAFQKYQNRGSLALRGFLVGFPKGADLHVHLSGAIYAETFIKDAAEDGLCIDPKELAFAKPPCAQDQVPAAD